MYFGIKLYMFQTVLCPSSGVFSLYTQQWYICWQLASRIRTELVQSWSYSQAVSKPVWHIPLLCVQWKTPDDGQRNCPKHVDFYSKNKFEKIVHLAGFIIRIYHAARSPEGQFITMHGHPNVNLSRCTVTRTSIYHDARSAERQFITMHGHPNVNLSRCTDTWTSDSQLHIFILTQGQHAVPSTYKLHTRPPHRPVSLEL